MAISVTYRVRIPYPIERVLSQYFDLEHLETVHPTTLGQARVLEVDGRRILFEQRWPAWLGLRLRTVAEQVWLPPDRIRIRFRRGLLRGVGVDTHLMDRGDETAIEETYRVPLVPPGRGCGRSSAGSWSAARITSGRKTWRSSCATAAGPACRGGNRGGRPAHRSRRRPTAAGPGSARRSGATWMTEGRGRSLPAAGKSLSGDTKGGCTRSTTAARTRAGRSRSDGSSRAGWSAPGTAPASRSPTGGQCGGPADGPVATYAVRQEGEGVFVRVPAAA